MTLQQKKILATIFFFLASLQLLALTVRVSDAAGPEPEAIEDLSAIDGNGSITLSWTAPNDNGSPITGYRVEYGLANGALNLICNDASCNDAVAGATVPNLTNFTEYQFQVVAINAAGESIPSDIVTSTPTPCSPLINNGESLNKIESQSCVSLTVNAGTLSLSNIPDSFQFPAKASLQSAQHSFGNDNLATSHVDVDTAADDVITVSDLRNAGGFDLTITSSKMTNGHTELPLSNLYVVTTFPKDADLTPLDSFLIGTEANGVEFADGSSNTNNMSSPVHSDNATGSAINTTQLNALATAYTTDGQNFDANGDGTPDTIVLMQSSGDRLARMSQAISFYLNIPADQEPGTYAVLFTLDLIPN